MGANALVHLDVYLAHQVNGDSKQVAAGVEAVFSGWNTRQIVPLLVAGRLTGAPGRVPHICLPGAA